MMKFDFQESELLTEIQLNYKNLPDTVRKCISDYILKDLSEVFMNIEECESPIEQLMSIALNRQADKVLPYYTQNYFVDVQAKIKANGKEYRADFLVRLQYSNKIHEFIVECDGHDFHEKTKEQVKRDKKRDRDLMLEGYTVIRFTGSEIVENPRICAREAINLITNYITKDS